MPPLSLPLKSQRSPYAGLTWPVSVSVGVFRLIFLHQVEFSISTKETQPDGGLELTKWVQNGLNQRVRVFLHQIY